ncbi:MAG: hypothetical protein R3A44_39015 [Caldilineaceae bacterium]
MNNPEAKEYLKHAAKLRIGTLRIGKTQGWELMAIANYYRLAGESQIAQNYFERAYEMLKRDVGDLHDPTQLEFTRMHLLILVCFALKRYEETAQYGAILREHEPDFRPSLLAPNVALLAEAKLTNNVAQAQRAIDTIASSIRASKIKIQTSGDITIWDAYELGLEVLAEIEANNYSS